MCGRRLPRSEPTWDSASAASRLEGASQAGGAAERSPGWRMAYTGAVEHADAVIIGAGAAGLMTAIAAGRAAPRRRIIILDGARTIGAKILVAGGGRCNVTHYEVTAEAYAGSSRNAIRKVLRQFDVPQTIAFFEQLSVKLKREETGKLFPVTDSAKTVLNALLSALRASGVELMHPRRVEQVRRDGGDFLISGEGGAIRTGMVVLATGGKSLPKTGSDGHGLEIARSLGHSITPRVFPSLVPLTMPRDHFVCGLSGITLDTTLTLRTASGKHLESFTNSTLCTHFGLSGPSVLDISRYWIDAKLDDPGAELVINWLPGVDGAELDRWLLEGGKRSVGKLLGERLPQRLVDALCNSVGVGSALLCHQLSRDQRRGLVRAVTAMVLPMTGNRGWLFAEVTAGGVPLAEIDLKTMQSRVSPGLYLVGEICDVDGRIGGFNFQWAWSSGHVAGKAIGQGLCSEH